MTILVPHTASDFTVWGGFFVVYLYHMKKYFPHILLLGYIVLFIILGIEPYARDVWYVENGPIVAIATFLVILYWRGIRFSNLGYFMMAVLLYMHTIGGHYTFERVPFQWFSDLFGFERNMYDRIAHFSVGFYAIGMIEYLLMKKLVARPWIAYLLGICLIGTVAAGYEIIEWIYAATSDPEAGAAFLGSQGDIWDAQKDMLADILGAITATVVYVLRKVFRKA